jgi:hypothetical protein
MKCKNVCLLPYGTGISDLDGPGALVSYFAQIILTFVLCPLLLVIQWVKDRNNRRLTAGENLSVFDLDRLFPQPRRHPESTSPSAQKFQRIFTSLYDTSVMVTTSLCIALLAWLRNPSAKIYQNVYSNLIAELSFGCLVLLYTLVGVYTRHPTKRFLASLVAFIVFVCLSVLSIIHGQHIIIGEARPFYATIGVDCSKIYPQQVALQESAFTTDGWHIFTLLAFIAFLIYFLVSGIGGIYRSYHDTKASSRIAGKPHIVAILLLYVAIYISAGRVVYRLVRYRDTFGKWNGLISGKPWDDNQWSFGQILTLFMWAAVLLNIGKFLVCVVIEYVTDRDGQDSYKECAYCNDWDNSNRQGGCIYCVNSMV